MNGAKRAVAVVLIGGVIGATGNLLTGTFQPGARWRIPLTGVLVAATIALASLEYARERDHDARRDTPATPSSPVRQTSALRGRDVADSEPAINRQPAGPGQEVSTPTVIARASQTTTAVRAGVRNRYPRQPMMLALTLVVTFAALAQALQISEVPGHLRDTDNEVFLGGMCATGVLPVIAFAETVAALRIRLWKWAAGLTACTIALTGFAAMATIGWRHRSLFTKWSLVQDWYLEQPGSPTLDSHNLVRLGMWTGLGLLMGTAPIVWYAGRHPGHCRRAASRRPAGIIVVGAVGTALVLFETARLIANSSSVTVEIFRPIVVFQDSYPSSYTSLWGTLGPANVIAMGGPDGNTDPWMVGWLLGAIASVAAFTVAIQRNNIRWAAAILACTAASLILGWRLHGNVTTDGGRAMFGAVGLLLTIPPVAYATHRH